jgi:hypothetical protein
MKTTILLALIITTTNALANAKVSHRDPFWPVGYAPAVPEPEKPVEIPKPVEKEPPPPKPITEKDWKVARKLLKVSGYALANRPVDDKDVKKSLVIINNRHYQSGDSVKITSDGVLFIWKIGKIENNAVDLSELSATRVAEDQAANKRQRGSEGAKKVVVQPRPDDVVK